MKTRLAGTTCSTVQKSPPVVPTAADLLIPLPWIEKFAEMPAVSARTALERVQLRIEAHADWHAAWTAVNTILSGIAELRRQAFSYWNSCAPDATGPQPEVLRPPTGICHVKSAKRAKKAETTRAPRKPKSRRKL
jgi:hypothetical protein